MKFINWTDGMKIHKDHFIGLENSLIQLISQSSICFNRNNYGLLLSKEESKSILTIEGNKVVISKIRGITATGKYFELLTDKSESIGEIDEAYVYLKVNTVDRDKDGVGKIIKGEPPYQEFTFYRHNIVFEKTLRFYPDQIPVGKVKKEAFEISKDEEFFPPIIFMGQNYDLINTENFQFWNTIELLWDNSLKLLEKTNSEVSSVRTSESKFISRLCESIVSFLSERIDKMKIGEHYLTFHQFYIFCAALRRVQEGIVKSLSREEYLQIKKKYSKSQKGIDHLAILREGEFIKKPYVHVYFNGNLDECREILLQTKTLLASLLGIDLNPKAETEAEPDV